MVISRTNSRRDFGAGEHGQSGISEPDGTERRQRPVSEPRPGHGEGLGAKRRPGADRQRPGRLENTDHSGDGFVDQGAGSGVSGNEQYRIGESGA